MTNLKKLSLEYRAEAERLRAYLTHLKQKSANNRTNNSRTLLLYQEILYMENIADKLLKYKK